MPQKCPKYHRLKLRVFTQQHMGIQHAHSNSHTDMNVFIEYVSVITAWQNYTYTQQMHNNTWNHNTSQWKKTQLCYELSCPVAKTFL